jgi:hypothetical protein
MTVETGPGEPVAGPWRVVPINELLAAVFDPSGAGGCRPWTLAVDGRSAGGKTTLAERLAALVPGAVVVHTDDIAWHHSFSTGVIC